MKALICKLIVNDFVTFKDNKSYKKKYSLFPYNAFTLAEILITLGLIGVVAALTIPTLISNYQKQATVSGLQKAYSALSQAINRSIVDNGPVKNWDFPTTQYDGNQCLQFVQTYLSPYLNISKNCGLMSVNSSCWPPVTSIKKLDGTNQPAINNVYSVLGNTNYILSDGMTLNITYAGSGGVAILVDINGLKKPNMMGKDIFSFIFFQNDIPTWFGAGNGLIVQKVKSGTIYPDGSGMDIASPGTFNQYQYRGCGKDVTANFSGAWCTQKIIQDGWQIASDYPWD